MRPTLLKGRGVHRIRKCSSSASDTPPQELSGRPGSWLPRDVNFVPNLVADSADVTRKTPPGVRENRPNLAPLEPIVIRASGVRVAPPALRIRPAMPPRPLRPEWRV